MKLSTYTPKIAAKRLREAAEEAESENYHGLVEPLCQMADLVESTTERVLVMAITDQYSGPEVFYVQPKEKKR